MKQKSYITSYSTLTGRATDENSPPTERGLGAQTRRGSRDRDSWGALRRQRDRVSERFRNEQVRGRATPERGTPDGGLKTALERVRGGIQRNIESCVQDLRWPVVNVTHENERDSARKNSRRPEPTHTGRPQLGSSQPPPPLRRRLSSLPRRARALSLSLSHSHAFGQGRREGVQKACHVFSNVLVADAHRTGVMAKLVDDHPARVWRCENGGWKRTKLKGWKRRHETSA
jgi:hypothetical protein